MQQPIGLSDIEQARSRISVNAHTTPVVESPTLSKLTGVPVYLKLEHQQVTGSFKLRGATNAISQLSEAQRSRGVVGVSTG
ncbi:MAG: threonine dehydratase, partial [Reinekea sp.]